MSRTRAVVAAAAATAFALALGLALSTSSAGAADDPAPPLPNRAADKAARAVPATTEQLFVPIAACRIANTRTVGGPLKKATSRAFSVRGTSSFAAQGGSSTGCGVASAASSVVVTVSSRPIVKKKKGQVKAKAGSVKAWATGAAEPAMTLLYYYDRPVAAGTSVSLAASNAPLTVKNYGGKAHVTIDVTGYYLPQMWAYISSSGTILDQSGRLVSATKTGTGTYALVWDRDITNCAGNASSDVTGHIESVYTTGANSYIYTYNNAGTPSDYWSNVQISC